MTREKIPVILRHDNGQSFVITYVSRVTGSAVSAAVKKCWDAVTAHTGGNPKFERAPYLRSEHNVNTSHVMFRAGDWLLICERAQ